MTMHSPAPLNAEPLTQVHCLWIEGVEENWIRFGRVVSDRIVDRRRRIIGFAPGNVFAFVCWRSNDYGTVFSAISIIRAVNCGQSYTALKHIEPGGELLLHITGWPKVHRVLGLIDTVEEQGIEPTDAAPDYWRHVHSRLMIGDRPRSYSLPRHRAWLCRRRLSA